MKILVVHSPETWPIKTAFADHLYAFARYSGHAVFHVNLTVRKLPRWLLQPCPDLVIFETIFLAGRAFSPQLFREHCRRIEVLRKCPAVKVAMPQDEFLRTDALCAFIEDFGIEHVFSIAPAQAWPKLYGTLDAGRVRLYRVLAGYLEPVTLQRIARLAAATRHRSIDVSYRAWQAPPWLGRHGRLKVQVAEVFERAAREHGLRADISVRPADTLIGDKWYELLLRSKYTVGVESGSSILDLDGSIQTRTDAYLAAHPRASFETVERHCFADLDGSIGAMQLSPRHLEACATRTCQILVEGDYNGVLRPWEHYIPLKRDFSNLEDVLRLMREDKLREDICERAWRDVVASGKYNYQTMVDQVLMASVGEAVAVARRLDATWYLNELLEALARAGLRFKRWLPRPLRRCLRHLRL